MLRYLARIAGLGLLLSPAQLSAGNEATDFWKMIDSTLAVDQRVQEAALIKKLAALSDPELEVFAVNYREALDEAYSWDLWGAAYVINGGASDDAFRYFRDWLISRGSHVYRAALADPESLAHIVKKITEEEIEFEAFGGVVASVYMRRFPGQTLPSGTGSFEQPAGKPWDENELDRLYPKLTEIFLARYR
ncbi:MAG: DUF4240 domain-containing protein [Hyphomicrobiales bacterium]|nr:DUF4240 domain-containing protein [Hyphomicrobiales bacterium]